VASTCVTVAVREATSDKAPLSIADIEVMTEIDGPEAADRLVASLAQGTSCSAHQALLVAMGVPALAKVASTLRQATPGPGRECLVEALAAMMAGGAAATPEAAEALVAAIARATASEEKIIIKLLPALPHPPIEAIASILLDDKREEADRLRAARVLASVGTDDARNKLIAAVGIGQTTLRKGIRNLAAGLKPPAAAATLAAYQAATDGVRRADLSLALGASARREPEVRPAVLATLRATLQSSAGFEERARAIQALGLMHDAVALDTLADLRTHDSDGVLRSLAVGELANVQDAKVLPALRAALDDADPRVRESAVAALARLGDKASARPIVAGAKQEPWPTVRRAEIAALGELCVPEGNELLLRAFQRDVEEVRQAALVGLAHCAPAKPAKVAELLLRVLGRLPESADMRSLAARLLAERKDPTAVHGMVEALGRLLSESQADLSLETTVADTAMALAALGGAEAISALVGLLSDPRPSLQRVAVDALGVVCDPGAGVAALHRAAGGTDESVSIPAAAAEARCRNHR
jgi:HEAT repeat protein